MEPTINTINAGVDVALANKEKPGNGGPNY